VCSVAGIVLGAGDGLHESLTWVKDFFLYDGYGQSIFGEKCRGVSILSVNLNFQMA
jgi:hypothetical protein